MKRRHALTTLAGATALLASPGFLHAENRPVTLVVGSTAGGSTDTLARTLGKLMGEDLGRSFVIDNKPGGNGAISDGYVARAKPDGTTLLVAAMALTLSPLILKNPGYDPVESFTPIAMMARLPNILVARKDAPFSTTQEFIAYAKEHPGKINFGVVGLGTSIHLAGEDFKHQAGIEVADIPYKSTSAALVDLMGGSIDAFFVGTASALQHVRANKIKGLAVTSKERISHLPDIPTISETMPGFESIAWFGLFGPAHMDPDTVARLHAAADKALHDPEMIQRIELEGGTAGQMSQAEFAAFVHNEVTRLKDLATRANISFT